MTLVVDASVAFELVVADTASQLRDEEMIGPPLLRSEVRSALHVASLRGILEHADAAAALDALEAGTVKERRHRRLGYEAWRVADTLGWAKTYDAEYLALASLLRLPLVTFDRRVLRAAERVGVDIHTFS